MFGIQFFQNANINLPNVQSKDNLSLKKSDLCFSSDGVKNFSVKDIENLQVALAVYDIGQLSGL